MNLCVLDKSMLYSKDVQVSLSTWPVHGESAAFVQMIVWHARLKDTTQTINLTGKTVTCKWRRNPVKPLQTSARSFNPIQIRILQD